VWWFYFCKKSGLFLMSNQLKVPDVGSDIYPSTPMESLIQILYAVRDILIGINHLSYLWRNLRYTFQRLIPRQKIPIGFQIPKSQPPKRKKRGVTNAQTDKLEAELLSLLRGDIPTAKRLLRLVKQQNPGRNYQWCLEKVIWDVERDRAC
jgi:hypothetical protein